MAHLIAAGIAVVVLFGIAAVVGWADLRHQRRMDRVNAQLIRYGKLPDNQQPPVIAEGRW